MDGGSVGAQTTQPTLAGIHPGVEDAPVTASLRRMLPAQRLSRAAVLDARPAASLLGDSDLARVVVVPHVLTHRRRSDVRPERAEAQLRNRRACHCAREPGPEGPLLECPEAPPRLNPLPHGRAFLQRLDHALNVRSLSEVEQLLP